MIAGIELGGSKTVVAIGTAGGDVHEEWRFPTTTPLETFQRAIAWLAERGTPEVIGVAAFGPVGVVPGRDEYGKLLATPKPGWAHFPIIGTLQGAFPAARITLETDVNAAALAEARLGAARGLDDIAYITIGTGIGAGILSGGRLIHGALHSEFGHIKVPRAPRDTFPGVCSFHGDCLEGLASGPAIAGRWGQAAADLPADHPAWDTETWYLAHGILALLSIASPARVIVGGGVSQAEGFHARTEALVNSIAAGYFSPLSATPYVLPPLLGQQAGIKGALLLAAPGNE
jgi:fructokinase